MKFQKSGYDQETVSDMKGSKTYSTNGTSRPSLEIGFLTDTEQEWLRLPDDQPILDFTTPEKGLLRYATKDLLKIMSSEDAMLKVPDTYLLHRFIYNSKTSSFIGSHDSESPCSIFEKPYHSSMMNMRNFGLKGSSSMRLEHECCESKTEVILKIPKCHPDSHLDIKLVGTSSSLNSNDKDYDKDLVNLYSSGKNSATPRNKIHLGLEKIPSPQADEHNYQIIASRAEILQDSCFCPKEKTINCEELETIRETDTNKVSIKLGENLFLSLVSDVDEPVESNCCEEYRTRKSSKSSDKLAGIKILVKCNGETIQEFCPTVMERKHKTVDEKQNVCVNKREEHDVQDVCSPSSCAIKSLGHDDECCRTCCMAINTTAMSAICSGYVSPKCSLKIPKEKIRNSCTKCPLVERRCGVPPISNKDGQKRNSKLAPPKESIQRNSGRNEKDRKLAYSGNSCCKISEPPKQTSSNCSCPPNKEDIVSLGSFSLFFIINDMHTGDCDCKSKSDSNELLKTAMICVRVDNSKKQIKSRCNQKNTSSCPSFISSPIRQTSVCSCPSAGMRGTTVPVLSTQSSAKSSTTYVCPYTKDGQKPSILSSMNKTPSSQPLQIRFSDQAGRGRNFSVTCTPRVEQTSVQACPSNKSACVQPSRTCSGPSTSQKSVQPSTCVTPTCSKGINQARQVLSSICPPSCKINLPLPCPAARPTCSVPMNKFCTTFTQDTKTGPSYTCTAVKSVSCPSLKQSPCSGLDRKLSSCTPSVVCVNESMATQSKSCSICIGVSRLNDSRDPSLKKVCSFSGECKRDSSRESMKGRIMSSFSKCFSKSNCSICRELAKLNACEVAVGPTLPPCRGKPTLIPATTKLKRAKNIEKFSHLDVSGAKNFMYEEVKKDDLQLFTEDYSDLKQAFEKFMVAEIDKNPKCKYIKKC